MAAWAALATDVLWRNGLTAIPLVLLTTAVCQWIPCRPATRHTMWLVVLAWLVTPPLLPQPPTPKQVTAWVTPLLLPNDIEQPDHTAGHEPRTEFNGPPREPVAAPAISPVQESRSSAMPLRSRPRRSRSPAQSMKSSPESALSPAPVSPESSPIPSQGIAARTASRSPDMLAQSTGAVGPLSENSLTAERVEQLLTAARGRMGNDGHNSIATPSFSKGEREGTPPQPNGFVNLDLRPVKTKEAPKIEPASGPDWRAWMAGLFAVRDAVTALPPLPTAVWLGGTVLLALVGGLRILRFRRHLRRALPAPESVIHVVGTACQEIGLRRVPETLMVDERVSPMIWCGLRPRLILPTPLWSQLDGPGRRAVVFHELAHVRRCDHWVSWLDQIIGSLYWWHPFVWWSRRRLHAEAEVCCDAWVTSLLPRTRRAYAEALLVTRQYVAEENRPMPALGIGVTTGRARRFARRLTMVMTESVKPRLSASGLALVLAMAMTGWLTSPAKSCPEEDKAVKAASKGSDKPCATPCASGKASATAASTPGAAPCAKSGATATTASPTEAGGPSTYEQHMAHRKDATAVTIEGGLAVQPGLIVPATLAVGNVAPFALASGRGGDQEERLNRLEERLERLGAQLERLAEAVEHRHEDRGPGEQTPRAPRAAQSPRSPRSPQPGQPLMAPMPPMPPMPPMQPMPSMAPGMGFFEAEGGEVFARVYALPQGKLEALIQLMSRSDVPILIRAQENVIEVNATEGQHRIFAAFVRLIHPSGDRSGARIAPGDDGDRRVADVRRRIEKEMEKAAKQRTKVKEKLERRREKTGARMDEIKGEATAKAELQEALEREVEELAEEAERLSEAAEDIREQGERLEERAGQESEREKRADLEREVLMLRHKAEALDLKRNQLEDRAHSIEDRANEAQDRAREAENRLEELQEELRQAEQEAAEEDNNGSHASVEDSDIEWLTAIESDHDHDDGNDDDNDDEASDKESESEDE